MICENCGGTIEIGSWPFCPDHGRPYAQKGFEPYFDVGLGQVVTGTGDINKALRPQWENDYVVKLDHRDKPESYYRELNERRRERAENAKRENR